MSETEDTSGEIEQLRAERDELRVRVSSLEGSKRSKSRSALTIVLVILSVLSLAAAVPGTWTRRTVLNTDRYVDIVSEVAEQPEVQAYLATQITNSAFEALDVQGRLSNVLGEVQPQLAFLAAPITQGIRDVVRDKVEELLASDRFEELWAQANRTAHTRILAVLEGDAENVQIVDGKVVINTLPLVNEALKGVAGLASDLVGRDVTLPDLTEESLSQTDAVSAGIARLESALGVDLPENFGVIEVYDGDEVAAVQEAVYTFDRAVVFLVVLWLLTFVAAIAVSQRRRRTLLQLLVAFTVVVVLERRFAIASVDQLVASLAADSQGAGRAAAEVMLSSLLAYTKWLLTAAIVVIVIALVTGPYSWAVRLRRGAADVGGLAAGMVRGTEAGPVARWVAARRDLVMVAAALVFAFVLLVVDVNLTWFLVLLVVMALVELAAWRTAEALSTDGG